MRIPKRIVALVSLLAALALLVGACGEGDPTSAPAPTNTPVPLAPTSPPQPEPTEAMPEPTATAAPLPTATPIPTATPVPQPTAGRETRRRVHRRASSPAQRTSIPSRPAPWSSSTASGQAYNQLVPVQLRGAGRRDHPRPCRELGGRGRIGLHVHASPRAGLA